MKVSIAVPTWEAHGRGAEFLDDLVRTVQIQTLTDWEIIVSDHCEGNEVKNVVKFYERNGVNIKYVRNREKRGSISFNANNAINHCNGEVVKVLFQDDFFYDDEALEKIYTSLMESDKDWLVCGCNHTQTDGNDFYWTMMPGWNDDIIRGVNSISSPSVLAFKNDKVVERFDENVRMMMDVEMYYHLDKNHGQPFYLMDDLITNRVHSEQLSSKINGDDNKDNIIQAEVDYCLMKHE
tara:strand:- start:9061 stop:9771 length:711 start_codon:yes stop_codon:yes gene_type:complete